jgi:hypothetical protein
MLYNVMRGKHLREENSIYNQRRVWWKQLH